MIKKRSAIVLKKHLDRIIAKLQKQRDEMRSILDDANEYVENCESAIEDLQIAADKLSEVM